MDEIFELAIQMISSNGWALGGIAVAGILLLGVLKYAGLFKKLEEQTRHFIYLLISVGFSGIAALIYALVTKSFQANTFVIYMTAVFSLNQAAYALYSNTGLKDLIKKLLEKIVELLENYKK